MPGGESRTPSRITTADHGGVTVISVGGEMDYDSVALIRAAVAAALPQLDGRALVLDLAAVDFLGSAGISALVDVARAAIETGADRRPLSVVVDHARAVIRPIQLSGLEGVLQLHETLEQALEA